MIRADRALAMNIQGGKRMPHREDMRDLYAGGWEPRRGELTMIAGRPGSQKSGFAMWICDQWDLPTLYFSGDMSPFTASARVASMRTGMTTDEVEKAMHSPLGTIGDGRAQVLSAIRQSPIQFAFGHITYRGIDAELNAWVERYNALPEVMVIDNLMDTEDAESDYDAQMEVMQTLSDIKTETGMNVIVLHHATEAGWDESNPWKPPARKEIKNKLGEKPECTLTVALNPYGPGNVPQLNVAVVKQRMARCDPSGSRYVTMRAIPELTRFESLSNPLRKVGKS